jgi:hypothetical protein
MHSQNAKSPIPSVVHVGIPLWIMDHRWFMEMPKESAVVVSAARLR